MDDDIEPCGSGSSNCPEGANFDGGGSGDEGSSNSNNNTSGARPKSLLVSSSRPPYKHNNLRNGFSIQNISDSGEDSDPTDENFYEYSCKKWQKNGEKENILMNGYLLEDKLVHNGPIGVDGMDHYLQENQHLFLNVQSNKHVVNDHRNGDESSSSSNMINGIDDNLMSNETNKVTCQGDKSNVETKGLVVNGFCYCHNCLPSEPHRPSVRVQVSFEDNGIVDEIESDFRTSNDGSEKKDNESIDGSFEVLSGKHDTCSPDTDFLDFDFDPGPSGDEVLHPGGNDFDSNSNDSLDEDDKCIDNQEVCGMKSENISNNSFPHASNDLGTSANGDTQNQFVRSPCFPNQLSSPKYQNVCLRTLHADDSDSQNMEDASLCSDNTDSDSINLEACSERLLRRESSLFNIPTEELDSDECNLQSALLNSFKSKVPDKRTLLPCDGTEQVPIPQVEPVFLWSEREACMRQVLQISTSACGPTALINVLLALEWPAAVEKVIQNVPARLRAESAPIPEYLFSRSVAGTNHNDLTAGMEKITNGQISGRFFQFFPPREVSLLFWLADWMKKGAVPVCTLNLQRGVTSGETVPDSWHHQMVFAVGPRGVYFTNPVECVTEELVNMQLCSEPVLLIRRADIISRWTEECDLSPLITTLDTRWRQMNVIGQVVNVLREFSAPKVHGYKQHVTGHVTIPAGYCAGVTVFARTNSEVYKELIESPELPMLPAS